MAKWAGYIGFGETVEKEGSIWDETVVEHPYTGDMIKSSFRDSATSEKVNDELSINNNLSIIADNFAIQNFQRMKYATILGARWKVTSATVDFPRVTVFLGGVYNGPGPDEDAQTAP